MNSNVNAWQVLVCLASVPAIVSVLFSDVFLSLWGGYADQRFLQVFLSGLVLTGSFISVATKKKTSPILVFYALLPTFLFSLAFVVLSLPFIHQPHVWVEPGMYFFFFMAVVVTGLSLAWSGAAAGYAHFLTALVAGGCFLYGAMSINVYLFTLFDGVSRLDNFIPWGFVNIRYWSQIATWFLPLLPLAVLTGPLKKHQLWRLAVASGAGLWWWIIFLSTARGSALGIAFGATVAALLIGRKALPWIRLFLQYFFIGVVIWLLLSIIIPSFMGDNEISVRSIKTDSSGRLPLFVEAWRMSLQNFPFGMGPQSWLTHEALTETYAESKKFGHPHNMYFMWAAEYGWILIGFLGLTVLQAVRYFCTRRAAVRATSEDEQALLLTGLTASVSAALFHAGVSAVFMAPGSMLVGLFVLTGFWALILPEPTQRYTKQRALELSKARKLTVLLLTCILVAIWGLWSRQVWIYYDDMRHDETYYQQSVGGGKLPRFWFHGNFPRK